MEWLASEGMADDLTEEKWRDREERNRHIDHVIEVLGRWTLTHKVKELVEKGQLMHFPWAEVAAERKMNKKGEISALKAWLMVLASLIDDAAVLVLIFLGLWFFHVKITWPLILVIAVVMVAFVFIMHQSGSAQPAAEEGNRRRGNDRDDR